MEISWTVDREKKGDFLTDFCLESSFAWGKEDLLVDWKQWEVSCLFWKKVYDYQTGERANKEVYEASSQPQCFFGEFLSLLYSTSS